MNTTTLNTTTIQKRTVLANATGRAIQYANRTAADKSLAKLNTLGQVFQSCMSRRFYVEIF